ncbi:MAG: hypothetical protein OEY49_11070, partial [Candidatus Heimdallarchaeota archaeon]|nr:hypothetical protein [Candidatus Heimdallarchaeota archaeon]
MRATISGIGTIIDTLALLFIVIKLYKPTKQSGFNPTNFRGSLFWMFVNFGIFTLFMSFVLITDDPTQAGLIGYVIGHIFLYIGIALYIFAPFSIIRPDDKKLPGILSIILLISGIVISYINWMAYSSGEYTPKVSDNNVMLWNPPPIVFFYIVGSIMFAWGIFGTGLFWYHAKNTTNKVLKKRSFLIGLGFLIFVLSGPPHDAPDPNPIVILIVDALVAIGTLIQGYSLTLD